MKYNFDQNINRYNTSSKKWDDCEAILGETGLISMWIADMDFQVPHEVVKALEKRAAHGIFGYTATPDSYLDAVSEWMKRRHHWNVEKNWICHSPGVVSALSFIIDAFTEVGDKIVIQSPVYYPFGRVIRTSNRVIVDNPLKVLDGRYYMDLDDFRSKLDARVKLLFLCSPHNPVGRVWTKNELLDLANICLEHNIIIVADEVHSDLLFKGYKHTCLGTLSEEILQKMVFCSGASKTFNLAGLKTSSIIIPNDKLRESYIKIINNYNVGSGNLFGLVATETAYNFGEEWLEQLLDYLQENLDFLLRYFEEKIPKIKVIKPEGTYLIWLDCRNLGMDDKTLAEFCLKKAKVKFDPGVEFGTGGQGFMRINIACPRSVLQEGLKRLEQAVNSL